MAQNALPELAVMQQLADIASTLAPAERKRVALWFVEYASVGDDAPASVEYSGQSAEVPMPKTPTAIATSEVAPAPEPPAPAGATQSAAPISTFAELYAAAAPHKGAQKAAVAAYWLEAGEGQGSWKAFDVNKLLKSVGVKVSSMSIVLTNAVKAKNPLVEELARLGEGERSRKTFRLTPAGRAYVEGLLG